MRINLLDNNVHRELKKFGFVEKMTKTEDPKDCYYQYKDVIIDGWGNVSDNFVKLEADKHSVILSLILDSIKITQKYFFYYEGEEDGWTFEIEAKYHEEAFNKAYETHGPQVEDMYYRIITN